MDAAMKSVRGPDKNFRITKLKVKPGHKVTHGAILCIYETDETKGLKIKAQDVGTVHEILCQEGDRKPPGSVLVTIEPCKHPTVMKDMCAECGADLREELGRAGDRKEPVAATVAMVHSIPELIVSEEQAKEIGKEDENRLLKTRKLVLLVDLDQTLIHTTNDTIPANLKDVFHYQLRHGPGLLWYHTRIRPGTQHFLETISKMYELHICTFGVRMYAHTIARYLDPHEKYFSHRILSRDECFNQNSKTANLKALFPCGDKMVCIIDDREDVWNYAPNLIHVKPYRFFQGTADINAPPGLTKTEHDMEPVHHRVRRISRSKSVEKEEEAKVKDKSEEEGKQDEKSIKESENKEVKSKNNDEKKLDNTETDDNVHKCENNNKKDQNDEDKGHPADDNSEPKISIDLTEQENTEKSENSDENSENKMDVDSVKVESDCKTDDSVENKEKDELSQQEADCVENKEDNDVKENNESESISQEMNEKGENQNKEMNVKDKNQFKEMNVEDEEMNGEDELIEWDDDDDYLLYLEEILTRIHMTFFDFYDQMKCKSNEQEMPDLKNIITYIKKKVLQGCNIVFSGVFPTNMDPEKSRAYMVARALGANIHTNIISKKEVEKGKATTHLVAAKQGTSKVKLAQKTKGVKIVNPNWLWSCAERYEHVDERLFQLEIDSAKPDGVDSPDVTKDRSRKRKSDESEDQTGSEKRAKTNEDQEDTSQSEQMNDNEENNEPGSSSTKTFMNTFNPLLAFSDDDLAFMDKEVEDIMDDEQDDNSSEDDDERDTRLRSFVLSSVEDGESSQDSLSGDLPRGWKRKSRSSSDSPQSSDHDRDNENVNGNESENDLDQFENTVQAFAPDTESSDNDSIGSMDDEMAAAIEKEFLDL